VPASRTTVDDEELRRFAARADAWWDLQGGFRALHRLNFPRLDFIRSRLLEHFQRDPRLLRPFTGLSLLDIGCGGGLVAEPMARLGFAVTGTDAVAQAIGVARTHARAAGLEIDYRVATAEAIVDAGEHFDAVLALEVIEHVGDSEAFCRYLGLLVKPGGTAIIATLNRTARSFALAVVSAEYILGWLPRGTHDWCKFLRPSELILALRRNYLRATAVAGLSYDPRTAEWVLSQDIEVNYIVMAVRQGDPATRLQPSLGGIHGI
jgi:2-polyprenyl-6-hydroxyphenyl methylase / 3-demethylubiquinone-9 3-methyltransferase